MRCEQGTKKKTESSNKGNEKLKIRDKQKQGQQGL